MRVLNFPGLVCLALAMSICVAGSRLAAAQVWPVQPIRVIVPFTPGGRTDNIARVSGHKLGEAVGAQVVIDNRGGAGSANGWTGRCNRD